MPKKENTRDSKFKANAEGAEGVKTTLTWPIPDYIPMQRLTHREKTQQLKSLHNAYIFSTAGEIPVEGE